MGLWATFLDRRKATFTRPIIRTRRFRRNDRVTRPLRIMTRKPIVVDGYEAIGQPTERSNHATGRNGRRFGIGTF